MEQRGASRHATSPPGVLIPLDDEEAMRALARFAYSRERPEEARQAATDPGAGASAGARGPAG